MNPEYCDRIELIMDQAQAWCLEIEDLYDKTEVHSITTSQREMLRMLVSFPIILKLLSLSS